MRALIAFVVGVAALVLATTLAAFAFGRTQEAWDSILVGMFGLGSLPVAFGYLRLERGFRGLSPAIKVLMVAVAWVVLAGGLLNFGPPLVAAIDEAIYSALSPLLSLP